jgi:hypothetical protein
MARAGHCSHDDRAEAAIADPEMGWQVEPHTHDQPVIGTVAEGWEKKSGLVGANFARQVPISGASTNTLAPSRSKLR